MINDFVIQESGIKEETHQFEEINKVEDLNQNK